MKITDYFEKKIIIFDSAMGTALQEAGMKSGELPEAYNIEHPEIVQAIHFENLKSGSDVVTTNTFGASRPKLEGSGYEPEQVIRAAVRNAQAAVAQYRIQERREDGAADVDESNVICEDDSRDEDLGFVSGSVRGAGVEDESDVTCAGGCGGTGLEPVSDVVRGVGVDEGDVTCVGSPRGTGLEPDPGARTVFVALDVGPTGKLLNFTEGFGFDEAYEVFREQVVCGAQAGADLIIFETFGDITELKAGILAAKENTSLPVFCSMTFDENARMLMGSDPETAVLNIQDMGIDAVGVNCSLGPKDILGIAARMLAVSKIPVIVQPNAGMPRVQDGRTLYDVGAEEYALAMQEMAKTGAAVCGGCCGTTPAYIQAMRAALSAAPQSAYPALSRGYYAAKAAAACPSACAVATNVRLDGRVRIIGERINPAGKKKLREALLDGNYDYAVEEALAQVAAGADIIDVNAGMPGIDEKEVLIEMVRRISLRGRIPLRIDCKNPEDMEQAVRYCNGKPILNSVSGEKASMDVVFPIAAKYGTALIALTIDEEGIPKTAEKRLGILEKILKEAATYGIGKDRIIVDMLALTVSAEQDGLRESLEALRLAGEQYGVKTTLGASNVSFGLPERPLLNAAFLAMAVYAGLDAPITDPTIPEYLDMLKAAEVLTGRDRDAEDYIAHVLAKPEAPNRTASNPSRPGTSALSSVAPAIPSANTASSPSTSCSAQNKTPSKPVGTSASTQNSTVPDLDSTPAAERLTEVIIGGFIDAAEEATADVLADRAPGQVIDDIIVPAMGIIGDRYEDGRIFLPQMIRSADTVRKAFGVLKAAMDATGTRQSAGRIILATVQGDVHDIGKNIVKAMLENYGYDIIDLGKDVPPDTIVETAAAENIKLVGMSALMTTTMRSMEETIRRLKAAGLTCKTVIGGAVVTQSYADSIGADYYCANAVEAVRVAKEVFGQS
jgi:5-methyltetrahydrofolate--homocysteine methyltransferase